MHDPVHRHVNLRLILHVIRGDARRGGNAHVPAVNARGIGGAVIARLLEANQRAAAVRNEEVAVDIVVERCAKVRQKRKRLDRIRASVQAFFQTPRHERKADPFAFQLDQHGKANARLAEVRTAEQAFRRNFVVDLRVLAKAQALDRGRIVEALYGGDGVAVAVPGLVEPLRVLQRKRAPNVAGVKRNNPERAKLLVEPELRFFAFGYLAKAGNVKTALHGLLGKQVNLPVGSAFAPFSRVRRSVHQRQRHKHRRRGDNQRRALKKTHGTSPPRESAGQS
ncbi:hypothetical protein SDC9_86244 [bioreactor metagenome]|uniref:Uncharacterized protein n=1 Tax=bioreactor metagenome TaxID=1076179 RepID=A0A644ZFH2_9ZZZZ